MIKKVKDEQLVSLMLAIKKTFDLMVDDIVESSTENGALKKQIVDYDKKWLEESTAKLLEQIDNDKRANLFLSRMKK